MRPLNADEIMILLKKEGRMKRPLEVVSIEYRTAFPRTTICLINKGTDVVIGVAMRAKNEEDIPEIGRVIAFTRALNAL